MTFLVVQIGGGWVRKRRGERFAEEVLKKSSCAGGGAANKRDAEMGYTCTSCKRGLVNEELIRVTPSSWGARV